MSQATPAANVSQLTDNCPAGLWGENAGVVIFPGYSLTFSFQLFRILVLS